MSLTQQFLIISVLPLSCLGMIVYFRRADVQQRPLQARWTLVLLVATVWASSLLRLYGGIAFSLELVFSWGVVGDYAFSLVYLGVLLATLSYLATSRERSMLVAAMGAVAILVSMGLDTRIWNNYLPPFSMAGQSVTQFDLWGAVWVVSWLLPLLAGWLLTRQMSVTLPLSLFRKKISYWQLMMGLLLAGGLLYSIHDPKQPFWQQAGALFVLPALLLGTLSIARSQLPDVQLALRQGLRRLSGTLLIFGLTWGALWFITERLQGLASGISPELLLIITSALFAVVFTLFYRLVSELTRRLFLPARGDRAVLQDDYASLLGYLPQPEQLGEAFLGILEWNLNISDAWLLTVEYGPQGELVLRPLIANGSQPPEMIHFAADSPFTSYFYQNQAPLVQYDLDLLRDFADLPARKKEEIARWQRIVYVPLRTGDVLAGVVALGPKRLGELYTQHDFRQLQVLAQRFTPLLVQSRNLDHLRRVSTYVFRQNQALDRERQHLQSLVAMYDQFLRHISPELRRPFQEMSRELAQLCENQEEPEFLARIETVQQQLADLQVPFDKLINTAARLQNRANFRFDNVHLDEIARQTQQRLQTMAEARRVRIEFESGPPIPPILGDADQLQEAVQHLMHNAIKFNKIGGVVTVTCGTAGSDVYLRIVDSGVGIPPERMQTLWQGFPYLLVSNNGKNRKASLGLTLANFIVAAHGGRIEAESNYGSGSIFSLYLPLVLQE